ncbi:DUF805 domain-containing protein [Psychrobacter pygoscelis]|uniref:DUF805 domain-containing protein n=1 Tax=Psychrobacter pygoscelis TaxID=2488563 RepID=UPI001F600C44|nr:DUF805 domain-containing protein [Psychrobacter pygoscelis]
MKGIILNYSPEENKGVISGEDNNSYTFSTANWTEQAPPTVGDDVEFNVGIGNTVTEVSYGLLRKNYASTVPKSQPLVEGNVTTEWQLEENYNMFDWFKKCLRNYVNFGGRARRKEYWYFYLVVTMIYIVAAIIDFILDTDGILISIVGVAIFLPMLAVSVRRLHDINRSGWWYLVSIVPIIGGLIVLFWTCTDTYPHTNQWGAPARRVT